MGLEEIRSIITGASRELRAAGLGRLYLFGSQARGEAVDGSDIDLAFDIVEGSGFSLVDQGRLQLRLTELLGGPVDFVSRNGMRPRMRQRVDAEMVRLL